MRILIAVTISVFFVFMGVPEQVEAQAAAQGGAYDCKNDCDTWASCGGCMRGVGPYMGQYMDTCSCHTDCVKCEVEDQEAEAVAVSDITETLGSADSYLTLSALVAEHAARLFLNEEQNAVVVLAGCQRWSPAVVAHVEATQFHILKELGVDSYERFIASGDGTVDRYYGDADPQ